jgi:hypothetical protein
MSIRRVVLALAMVGLFGCGGKSVCEEAIDYAKQCGRNDVSFSGDCTADLEKVAKCLKGLSCADIKDDTKTAACAQ